MKRPRVPCKKDCKERAAGCHSEGCPHGWTEYEKAMKAYRDYIAQEQTIRDYKTEQINEHAKRVKKLNIKRRYQ